MLIKNKNDSSSFLQVLDETSMIASGPNSIATTRDAGNFINGPVSFSSPPTSYRFGGVFKFNPLITTCVPSTLATPISTLTLDLPIKNISTLTAITGIIASLL
jgi:hypothetical protein